MSGLKRLIGEIHHRSLWQVLLIYVGGAWVCYEIIDTVTSRFGLPAQSKAVLYLSWHGAGEKARETLLEASETTDLTRWITRSVSVGSPPTTRDALRALFRTDSAWRAELERMVLSPGSPPGDTAGYFLSRTAVYGGKLPAVLQHAYYDSARIVLEALAEELPESHHRASALGIAYAGLGRTQEAIREGKRALDLMPLSKDAWVGSALALDLAEIYVMVGEREAAIDQLDFVLSIAGYVSVAWLKADPLWDPLRDNPRFQELLEKYGDQQH